MIHRIALSGALILGSAGCQKSGPLNPLNKLVHYPQTRSQNAELPMRPKEANPFKTVPKELWNKLDGRTQHDLGTIPKHQFDRFYNELNKTKGLDEKIAIALCGNLEQWGFCVNRLKFFIEGKVSVLGMEYKLLDILQEELPKHGVPEETARELATSLAGLSSKQRDALTRALAIKTNVVYNP